MRTEIDGAVAFGPPRPKVTTDYTLFSTPDYLTGYARKILRDLVKVARMYNGRTVPPGGGEALSPLHGFNYGRDSAW